jgi:XTP/dITP diphosphohydrolase
MEFQQILSPHTILMPRDEGIEFDFDETGSTYLENGLGKARALFEGVRRPVIADDSGLSVPALGGAPGIYSARYGEAELGRSLSSEEKIEFLLKNMSGKEDRRCFFVCALVLYAEDYRFTVVQETLAGTVAYEPRGAGGFGYDPIFLLSGEEKTVAELDEDTKNRLSHRGKAGAAIKPHIDRLEEQMEENP